MTSKQNEKLQDLVCAMIYKWFGLNIGDLAKIAKPSKFACITPDEIQRLCREIGEEND
jgi:hypothetical protein|nr:MAG TPA: hypothetical protein [Bacteriophage sp.]